MLKKRRTALFGSILVACMGCAGVAYADSIFYTGANVTYTVLTTGFYDITAFGGQGGGIFGGLGGEAKGTILLKSGDVLTILVGGGGNAALAASSAAVPAAVPASTAGAAVAARALWRVAWRWS